MNFETVSNAKKCCYSFFDAIAPNTGPKTRGATPVPTHAVQGEILTLITILKKRCFTMKKWATSV